MSDQIDSTVIKFANVTATASGDTDLVAAIADKKICVVAILITSQGAAANVYLHDSADTPVMLLWNSTNPQPLDKLGVAGPAGISHNSNFGCFPKTTAGKKLQANLSGASAVNFAIAYFYSDK